VIPGRGTLGPFEGPPAGEPRTSMLVGSSPSSLNADRSAVTTSEFSRAP
jgi:hypothetical protein